MDWLSHLFSWICGQAAEHTWAPGGELLPVCQRCTGLYWGALISGVLHLSLKPRLDGRFLEVHGAFLLFMVPFGYHWLPQGPALRALTGVLFGFGLTTFLRLALRDLPKVFTWMESRSLPSEYGTWIYYAGAAMAALAVPLAGSHGNVTGFWVLTLGSAAGAVALLGLATANVVLAVASVTRLVCGVRRRKAADA